MAHRSPRVRQRLCLVAAAIVLLAGLVPIVDHYRLAWSVNRTIFQLVPFLEPDARLGWRNRPGFAGQFPLQRPEYALRYCINAAGQRAVSAEASAVPSPAAIPRLWVLGDSSPFGWGVEAAAAFPLRLQALLGPTEVVVENFGTPGYGSEQVKRLVRDRLALGPLPAAVVVWAGVNDTGYARHYWYWTAPFLRQAAFFQYCRNMRQVMAACHRRRVPLICVTLPCLESFPALERINRWLRAEVPRHPGVVLVDIAAAFARQPRRDWYAPLDDVLDYRFHPSAEGHAQVAAVLLPAIRNVLAGQIYLLDEHGY